MLAMPLTGWLMVSGSGKRRPLSWFGLFDIPICRSSKATGRLGHEAHGVLGWLMLALVVLHIAAALRHHLILRDSVLARMAPAASRARAANYCVRRNRVEPKSAFTYLDPVRHRVPPFRGAVRHAFSVSPP